jgi:tetratricopeptide (TPR) repeat protein
MSSGTEGAHNRNSHSQPFAGYFEALLKRQDFQSSPRRNELLRYLVDKSLSGQGQTLSEYAIALEVFQKPESFDQRIDSTVRSEISRLRKFVLRYYEGPGAEDPWQIVFPARGYVPQVLQVEAQVSQVEMPPREEKTPTFPWRFLRRSVFRLPAVAAAVAAAVVVGALCWQHHVALVSASSPKGKDGASVSRSHAVNPQAQALYLKGQYYWEHRTADSLQRAIDAYTQAIVADSDYAEAYAGLAVSYDVMPEYSSMPQEDAFSRAIAAANKAVSLDPSLSIAHRALAFGLFWSQTDIPRAFREFQESVALAPNDAEAHHWYATALNSVLRVAEAQKEIDIAQQLSPASRSILADQAWIHYSAGDLQALAKLRDLEAVEPDFRSPPEFLARIDLAQGNYDDYLEQLRRLAALSKSRADMQLSEAAQRGWDRGGKMGMLRAMKTVQEQAFAGNQTDAYDLARTCALLDEKEQAVDYLQAAFAVRDVFVLDTLRSDWAPLMNDYPPFERFRAQIRSRFNIAMA